VTLRARAAPDDHDLLVDGAGGVYVGMRRVGEGGPLNVDTGQNPRRHVVLIEIRPNAYNMNLSKTAGVILIFLGVIFFVYFDFFSSKAITVQRVSTIHVILLTCNLQLS
jgi:hypothetical protein